MTFKEFVNTDPASIVKSAVTARKTGGICNRARFGDCNDIVRKTLHLLGNNGITAKYQGGQFITNPQDEEEWDHSWILIGDEILDPTIDQFFSALDFDLKTKQPGVYYSDPDWDGDAGLYDRYRI